MTSLAPSLPPPAVPPAASPRGGALAGLWALALLPALIAVGQLGRLHPDEVYQWLEPAWYRAHGYGVLSWEWQVGLRNWAAPGVSAALLRVAAALGLTHPWAYRALLAVPQVLLQGWMLVATFRFAERRVGPGGAWLATLAMGLYGPVLVFAGRTLGESASAGFLVVALEALDRRETPARAGLVGGLGLGLAVVVRYGSAVMVLAALVWLVGARRWKALAFTCLSGLGVVLGLGALDALTWGQPFHSLRAYLDFNVLSGKAAAQFGASPPSFYLRPLLTALPLWFWAALPLGWRSWRQRPGVSLPALCVAVYVLAVLVTPHKEERFLYPALVLFVLAAAPGVAGWLGGVGEAGSHRVGALLLLATTVLAGARYPSEDPRGDQLRAIVTATRDRSVRGLLIVNEGLWGAGGFFYLGKNIPWLTCDWPQDANFQAALRDARFNRAVTFEGRALDALEAGGFRVVGRVGRETMLARD